MVSVEQANEIVAKLLELETEQLVQPCNAHEPDGR